FMESAAMVPRTVGGSAHLHFAVVAFAGFSQHLFLRLFVRSRSLAISGLPGDHHAMRQWHRIAGPTIETMAIVAGACNHAAAGRRTIRSHLAAKPDVHRHRNFVSDHYRTESGLLDGPG